MLYEISVYNDFVLKLKEKFDYEFFQLKAELIKYKTTRAWKFP